MDVMYWEFQFPSGLSSGWSVANHGKSLRRGTTFMDVVWDIDVPICTKHGVDVRGVRCYPVETQVASGGSVDYYQVKIANPTTPDRLTYIAECNDIIEALGMNYAEGNAFKAIWRSCAARTLGKKKVGGDAVYDAEKIVFFGNRILKQRKEQNV